MNNIPWCVDPFIQMAHTADGFYRVCCVGEVDRNSPYHTNKMTPLEFFNSDMMQTIRRDMLSGNFSETTSYACSQCIKNVNNGMVSRRELENERYLNVDKT